MRTCVWCGDPLPEPSHKGHRRQEFCKRPKPCRQRHYLWHKQMKHDAEMLAEPYWRAAYGKLVEQYKWLEGMVQERLADLARESERAEKLEERVEYYIRRLEDVRVDYVARLRVLGMSDGDIAEFDAYWKEQTEKTW